MFIFYLLDLLFYLSVCGFFLNYYYYLKSLIMMEFIVISIMLVMLWGFMGLGYFIVYVLILSVCEGILGLMFLILVYRACKIDSYVLVDYNF